MQPPIFTGKHGCTAAAQFDKRVVHECTHPPRPSVHWLARALLSQRDRSKSSAGPLASHVATSKKRSWLLRPRTRKPGESMIATGEAPIPPDATSTPRATVELVDTSAESNGDPQASAIASLSDKPSPVAVATALAVCPPASAQPAVISAATVHPAAAPPDEMPQFINVLRGEMSLVGPRPSLEIEVARYEPWYFRRFAMRPGLTCFWQVCARRYQIPFDEWMRLDLKYVDQWSLRLDLLLVVRTFSVVLGGTGE